MDYSNFNRESFVNNIKICAKSKGIAMKEVENEISVSKGYFSKVARKDGPTPNIEIVTRTAEVLGTLIDTLVFAKLSGRTPEDAEVSELLTGIYRDTLNAKIKWQRYEPDEIRKKHEGAFAALFDMAYEVDEDDRSEIPWIYCMDGQPANKWKTTRFMGYSYMANLSPELSMYIVGAEDSNKEYDEQGLDVILKQNKKRRVLFSTRTKEEPEIESIIRAIYETAEMMAFHKYDGVSLEWLREYQKSRSQQN